MQKIIKQLDELSGIETENLFARWLERVAFIFLILMILSAPHSIAATQIAWLSGMTASIIRFFIKPRPKFVRTPLDFALLSFVGWAVITSIFSYAPDISLDKLRNVGLFLIFYFVINNLRNISAVKFLAFALIFSCMVSAAWSPIERVIGRGVEISNVSPQSPLAKGQYFNHDIYLRAKGKNLRSFDNAATAENKAAPLTDGDTIVEVEGKKISTPDELVAEIEKNDATYLECFHTPYYFTVKVRKSDLLTGGNALEKLGVGSWKRNRDWRYAGFYGQIITYAEVLQMILSLVFGLFVALVSRHKVFSRKFKNLENETRDQSVKITNRQLLALGFCLVVMIFALLTTFTRSAEIAFLLSACSIVLANGNRKMLLGLAAIILPVALGGFFVMQQTRKVDFYDKNEASVNYRQTVYREGFDLWTKNPRNFLLGVGMDSVKRFKEEWHLFDNGRLEASHFHSTPLQLLVERGLPALLLWFWVLWIYARTLLRRSKFQIPNSKSQIADSELEIPDSDFDSSTSQSAIRIPHLNDWQTQGIILGCFGGLVGFFISSLVNYSLGDGEVAMMFFLLMGFGVSLAVQNSRFKVES